MFCFLGVVQWMALDIYCRAEILLSLGIISLFICTPTAFFKDMGFEYFTKKWSTNEEILKISWKMIFPRNKGQNCVQVSVIQFSKSYSTYYCIIFHMFTTQFLNSDSSGEVLHKSKYSLICWTQRLIQENFGLSDFPSISQNNSLW